jgi:hypothetical protein
MMRTSTSVIKPGRQGREQSVGLYSTKQNKEQRTIHILTHALAHTQNSSRNDDDDDDDDNKNNDNDENNNNGDKAQKTSDVKMQQRKAMNGKKQQHTITSRNKLQGKNPTRTL